MYLSFSNKVFQLLTVINKVYQLLTVIKKVRQLRTEGARKIWTFLDFFKKPRTNNTVCLSFINKVCQLLAGIDKVCQLLAVGVTKKKHFPT